MINGMSCSMTSTEAPSSSLMVTISGPKASVSRWARPAVGSSRQRTLASQGEQPGELDHPPGPRRQVADVVVPVALKPEEVDQLATSACAALVVAPGHGQSERRREHAGATLRLERNEQRLVDRELGKQRGRLERPAQPEGARWPGDRWDTSSPRRWTEPEARDEASDGVHQSRLARTVGADETDDLAALDVQASPCSTAAMPPKWTLSSETASTGAGGRRLPRQLGSGTSARRRTDAGAAGRSGPCARPCGVRPTTGWRRARRR